MNIVLKALAVCLCAWVTVATSAQSYPDRPIRLIVPFVPGGGTDTFARILGARMSETLGRSIIIDNRAGAQGNIGMALGAKAAPDGYTLTFAYVGLMAINPHLFSNLEFDPLRDFAAVARGTEDIWMLVVHPSLQAGTAKEFAALARQYPEKFSSGVPSSAAQLLADIFSFASNAKIVHVHYKGTGPMLIDLIAGNVHFSFVNPAGPMQYVKSGRLRALMVTGNKRHGTFPDVPHAMEIGYPDLDLTSWYGIAAPAATPRAIIERLNAEAVSALKHPDTVARLHAAGQNPSPSTSQEFQEQIRKDYVRWGKAVKASVPVAR